MSSGIYVTYIARFYVHACVLMETHITFDIYHVQRGSAKHSVKGGLAFLWEMRFFDPPQLSPQWSDNNEILHMWLRHGDHAPCKFLPSYLCQSAPWNGVKYNQFVSVPFLCFHLHAMRRDELADFHDLCVKWRHSVEGCAFWGLELHFTPFGGRLPPKTAPKRPSKGKFKPKQKIREFELIFLIEDQSSPNFINICRNIVCIRH